MKYLLKTIIRNFTRKPVTNLINLLGLTISLTLVIILSLYCYSELTTDRFHKNGERIFLYSLPGEQVDSRGIYTPGILKENIDNKVPGVESTIRTQGTWSAPVFQVENREPVASDLVFADEDFFKFFTYKVIDGNPESALKEPLTIVITESLAAKLFGQEQAIGGIIKLNNRWELTVRAIIREPNANSCLSFSAVTSISTQKLVQGEDGEFKEWGWMDFQTFLLLNKETNPVETEKTILNIIPADHRESFSGAKLIPLRGVYFSKFFIVGSNYLISGDRKKVIMLVMVAVLVLMIALVNFINISSSQWLGRIKQTGIMKIIGARRSTILINVLCESFLFFLSALLLAVYLVNAITPFISEYTGIHYSPELTASPGFIFIALAGILVLSSVFSIIPAIKVSSSNAIDNLKNTVVPDKTDFSSSGVFVTLQFTIAIALIAFTILIQKQVRFGSTNLGFSQKNIIGIKLTQQLDQKKEVLKTMLLGKPAISEVSITGFYPGNIISFWGAQMDMNGERTKLSFNTFNADAAFFEILGLSLTSGRYFSDDLTTDKDKIVVNETFVREYNLTNPLTRKVLAGERSYEIIGVVKDFNFKPVTQPLAPLVIRNESFTSYCLVKLNSESFKSLLALTRDIQAGVSELSPSFPVEVSFLDQSVENMYQSELQFRRTFSLFAVCAVVICCLGILAMSLFACQRRIKEIGIRKINGARVTEVIIMLNKEFVKLVVIAFVIATPVAWFAVHRWLDNFTYKTEISWWIFALAGLIALGIALLTVSWQSWRTATRNPVETLRYE